MSNMEFKKLSEEAVEHLKESGYRTASGESHNMWTSRESVEESHAYQLGINQFIVEQKMDLKWAIDLLSDSMNMIYAQMRSGEFEELHDLKQHLIYMLEKYDNDKKDLKI